MVVEDLESQLVAELVGLSSDQSAFMYLGWCKKSCHVLELTLTS